MQVKDLDIGLLDFPCAVDDEIVLLCWKYGEEKIEYWHGMEEGFKGRKPIDERILRGKKREAELSGSTRTKKSGGALQRNRSKNPAGPEVRG